jgi:uncharacterized protein (DUF983 family)
MFEKGTKMYSIRKFKCPHCQEGDFLVSNIYDLSHVGDVRDSCEKCDASFTKEPGFYFGAMYVAYGIGVVLILTLWATFNLLFENISTGVLIAVIVLSIVILSPYLFASSKIIWANMFIPYDSKALELKEKRGTLIP